MKQFNVTRFRQLLHWVVYSQDIPEIGSQHIEIMVSIEKKSTKLF